MLDIRSAVRVDTLNAATDALFRGASGGERAQRNHLQFVAFSLLRFTTMGGLQCAVHQRGDDGSAKATRCRACKVCHDGPGDCAARVRRRADFHR